MRTMSTWGGPLNSFVGLVESGLDVTLVSVHRDEHIGHDIVGTMLCLGTPILDGGRNLVAGVSLHLELMIHGTADLLLSVVVVADAVFLLLVRFSRPRSRAAGHGRVYKLFPTVTI